MAVNQANQEVAYVRFSMGNYSSIDFYRLFDALQYHGGVSGIGASAKYTVSQVERALQLFQQQFQQKNAKEESDFAAYERREIQTFIENCLSTAKKEGIVRISYS